MRSLLLLFLAPAVVLGLLYFVAPRPAFSHTTLQAATGAGGWGARVSTPASPTTPKYVVEAAAPVAFTCSLYEGGAASEADAEFVSALREDVPAGETVVFSFRAIASSPLYRVEVLRQPKDAAGNSLQMAGSYYLAVSFAGVAPAEGGFAGATDQRFDATQSVREIRLASRSAVPYAWIVALARPECPQVSSPLGSGSLVLTFARGAGVPGAAAPHVDR